MIDGLFGEEFDIKIEEPKVKDIVKKAKSNKKAEVETDPEKLLKSKKVSLQERLAIITKKTLEILGHQRENVLVIKDRITLHEYISKCIAAKIIAIDTETNNSLDPVTCKLMGPCFYAPGLKQAYVPLNHINPETKERLPWQLTEKIVKEELQRILDMKTFIIMHNGKFDYEVLKCTCDGIMVPPNWDTIIGVRLMDENTFAHEKTSLKYIYTKYINPAQEKYSIEELFENIQFAYVDPEIFALYAATDSMMTYEVYEWEKKTFFDLPENADVLRVFKEIEMPIVQVTAEMEIAGVAVDLTFGEALHKKYTGQLNDLDAMINEDLAQMKKLIKYWKLFPATNRAQKKYPAKKTKMAPEKIVEQFPFEEYEQNKDHTFKLDKDGNKIPTGKRYKFAKSMAAQLEDEVSLSSPVQLGILLFDVMALPHDLIRKNAGGTGEAEIKALNTYFTTVNVNSYAENAARRLVSTLTVDLSTVDDSETILKRVSGEKLADDTENTDNYLYPTSELPGGGGGESNEDEEEEEDEEINVETAKIADYDFSVVPSQTLTPKELTLSYNELASAYVICFDAIKSLCLAILKRRAVVKLLTTYINVIPDLAQHWPDNRIRFRLDSMGTDTGRYSSGGKLKYFDEVTDEQVVRSGINIQNIPAHNKEIRMLFKARIDEGMAEATEDGVFVIPEMTEVETTSGWKYCKDLEQGDRLIVNDVAVNYLGRKYLLETREWAILAY